MFCHLPLELFALWDITQNRMSDQDSTDDKGDDRFMIELFENDAYADMTITSQGRVWECHRNILCPRSKFFDAALSGRFTVCYGKYL